MKKNNIYLLVIIFLFFIVPEINAAIGDVTIQNISVKSIAARELWPQMAADGLGLTYKVPGVVRAVGGTAPLVTEVAENVIMAIPAARGARILEAVAMMGLMYLGSEGMEYLSQQAGIGTDGTNLTKTGPNYAAVPTNCVLTSQCGTYVGNFTDGDAAMNAVTNAALAAGLNSGQATSNWEAHQCQKPDGSWFGGFKTSYYTPYFCSTMIPAPVYPVQTTPVTTNDLAPGIENDLSNVNSPNHQNAIDALIETLNRVNQALQNLNDTMNQNKTLMNNIKNELNQSIPSSASEAAKQDIYNYETTGATTQTTYDNVYNSSNTNQTTNNSTTNNYNTTNNTTNNNTTNNTINNPEPNMTPLNPYTGGNTIGLSEYQTPTVDNFSELFTNFINTMKEMPLFSLPGLLSSSVPSGGSCSFEVNMSERFGGVHTVSICNWATGLSYMKAVLLCMASIFAVGIIAKGGGG